MSTITNIFILILIPVLVSLSWLFGGNLIRDLNPMTLTTGRIVLSAIVLFFVSSIVRSQKNWTWTERKRWWKNQAFLSLTGRVFYYYFSVRALLTISPFEAVLVTTQLPILSIFLERIFGMRTFPSLVIPVFGIFTSFVAAVAVWSVHFPSQLFFRSGYIDMLFAILCFGIHLVFYKEKVRDSSSVNPLFAQFLLASFIMLPLALPRMDELWHLDIVDWGQMFIYTFICGLLPFILVHHALKKFTAFSVASVSILSPVFAVLFKGIYTNQKLSLVFITFIILTCICTFLTLKMDMRHKKQKPYALEEEAYE